MKIAILGAGALGSVVGGYMAQAGIDVCLLDINQAHIDTINSKGLRFDTPDGSSQVNIPAYLPKDCPINVELIVLLTKIIHTREALRSVNHVIDTGTYVLTIQNGLGNADRVAEIVPADHVLYGSTMIPGGYRNPGHVATEGKSWTRFKALNDEGELFGREVEKVLSAVGFEYDHEADIKIWQKTAFNCAMNATCGLIGGPAGIISESEEAVNLVKSISDEVVSVARAHGVAVEPSSVHEHLEESLRSHPNHKPSMLQDFEAGRATEIEALCGEVGRLAEAVDVPVPLNKALAILVRLKRSAVIANYSSYKDS